MAFDGAWRSGPASPLWNKDSGVEGLTSELSGKQRKTIVNLPSIHLLSILYDSYDAYLIMHALVCYARVWQVRSNRQFQGKTRPCVKSVRRCWGEAIKPKASQSDAVKDCNSRIYQPGLTFQNSSALWIMCRTPKDWQTNFIPTI